MKQDGLEYRTQTGFCRGCRQAILWITTKNGMNMKCQAKRTVVITKEGETVFGFEPHWGYCPKRDMFKK